MDRFKDFFSNVSGLFGRMTPSQVMVLFGIVAGSIAGIVLLVGWLSSVAYAPLYSNLTEEEAGEIVGWLNDQHIPYKLTQSGKTIEVPSDQKYKARLALANEGLPKSGTVGYSIFDNNNLGMTDFLQNLNFRRALEGELTKTIMELNEVEAARVHIVIPKDRLFKEDKKDATASVVLKLKGNRTLDRQQTDGITHLVAASVEGLSPDNITIVDYDGNLLSSGQKGDPLAGLSSSQLDARQKVEMYLEQKAQSMLNNVLGTGKSVVRVTADLNFSQLERTSENYDPNSAVVRSEERTKTTSSAEDKAAAEAETGGTKENQNNETTVTNYEISKTVEHLIDAVGTINKLSVAVLVDGIYVPATGDGATGEPTYQPRPQEEMDRLSAIVKNAVGYDGERNDQIEMVNIAFDRQGIQEERKALDTMYTREYYTDIGTKVFIGVLILLALLYIKKKVSKFFAGIKQLIPAQAPVTYKPVMTGQPMQQEIPQMPMEPRKARVVDKLQDVAKDKPEEIARVIKTMMVE